MNSLAELNRYWNEKIPYRDHSNKLRDIADAVQNGGKCYDYVHAKGRQLQGQGFSPDEMQVGFGFRNGQPHSVLIVGGQVLDNMHNDPRPASEYGDFNTLPFSRFFR